MNKSCIVSRQIISCLSAEDPRLSTTEWCTGWQVWLAASPDDIRG